MSQITGMPQLALLSQIKKKQLSQMDKNNVTATFDRNDTNDTTLVTAASNFPTAKSDKTVKMPINVKMIIK